MKIKVLLATLMLMALLPLARASAANLEKFTFTSVTFPDGTIGDLQASSKINNKGQFTTCSYYSGGEYLGYFQSAEFASFNADAVLQFCLDNYANRDVH